MKKIILLLSVFFITTSAFSLECSKSSANKVKQLMSQFGGAGSQVGYQTFTWNSATDTMDRNSLSRLIIAYADADACLMSSSREIRFYRNGKLEAVIQPGTGIRFMD